MKWAELQIEKNKPLEYKIDLAKSVIEKALTIATKPALAFSAGKDSTVLLDMIRRFFPGSMQRLEVIRGNTGVEFPECSKFARWISTEWNLRYHEARPGKTDRQNFKYAAQRRILKR